MPDSQPAEPQENRLLPDTAGQAAKPGSVVVRLETTHEREGALDGAWWPRSRDIAAELPALIDALTEHLGPVDRVGLDAGAWEGLPTRLTIDDRVVHIDSYPVGDDTVLVTRGEQDHFSLLVVPPETDPVSATWLMAAASDPDDTSTASGLMEEAARRRTAARPDRHGAERSPS
ncbi:DUF5994 family protein [Streptomyces sp. NPDC051207]|uniref:DUF5994 family protein n=1 Tax=Streptomyces sp. NPDC051207 TaxID=3154641 RepID=UPI0034358C0E